MRIYLDSCVFRELKKPENEALLKAIVEDKANNIYCYSEAHLLGWRLKNMIIELTVSGKLRLAFFSVEYLQNLESEDKETSADPD